MKSYTLQSDNRKLTNFNYTWCYQQYNKKYIKLLEKQHESRLILIDFFKEAYRGKFIDMYHAQWSRAPSEQGASIEEVKNDPLI